VGGTGVQVLHVVFGWVCVHAIIYNNNTAAWYKLELDYYIYYTRVDIMQIMGALFYISIDVAT